MSDGYELVEDLLNMEKQEEPAEEPRKESPFSSRRYFGSLLFNIGAFVLPALYSTLSKLWVANIDKSQVATTDVYTYLGVVINVINEGLPRTAWLVIGDKSTRSTKSRLSFAYTMIVFQVGLGVLLSSLFLALAQQFASAFVPAEARATSLTYVRISSLSALSSSMEVVVACCTRALDRPNVPLLISSVKFVVNMLLDVLFISKFHVIATKPTVVSQALIRMTCDLTSALCGLLYFFYISIRIQRDSEELDEKVRPKWKCLKILARPAFYTVFESAIRNGIYLWLIGNVVSMGSDYATAWGIFNSIRQVNFPTNVKFLLTLRNFMWGLVMVITQSLEASALTFTGHQWGIWRAKVGAEVERPKATNRDLLTIATPALMSTGIAVAFETVLCITMSFWGVRSFAFYLSQSDAVAEIVQKMWMTIDWCYIFYALSYELASLLLATVPRWYLFHAMGSNFCWMLPWAIAMSIKKVEEKNAWHYHSIIFGGALIFDSATVVVACVVWAWLLRRGGIGLAPVMNKT